MRGPSGGWATAFPDMGLTGGMRPRSRGRMAGDRTGGGVVGVTGGMVTVPGVGPGRVGAKGSDGRSCSVDRGVVTVRRWRRRQVRVDRSRRMRPIGRRVAPAEGQSSGSADGHGVRGATGRSRGRRPKRAEKHVSVLDAILTPVLIGPYEALLSKPIRPVRSGELASCTQCDPQR